MSEKLELVGVRKMSRFMGCHEVTLRKWAAQNLVPYYRLGKVVKFDKAEVLAAIKRGPKTEK